MANTPNTPSLLYNKMHERFVLCEALMGGTVEMRRQGEVFLPQFAKETDSRYQKRRDNSVLFDAYRNTIQTLSGKPFGTPVQLKEGSPVLFEDIAKDVDLTGTDLTTFSRQLLEDLLVYGKCHFIVDYPDTNRLAAELARSLTKADEKRQRLRPYFIRLKPSQLIGWQGSRFAGIETLQGIRFRESTYEKSAEAWTEVQVDRVIHWQPDVIESYKYASEGTGEWVLDGPAQENTLEEVPLVTVYANRSALLTAFPPLEGLAHLNQKHWRNQSDQDQIETVNRVPILTLLGFADNEVGSVEIGPYKVISNKSGNARVEIVETSGKAVEVGQKGIDRVENQMQAMSLQPLIRRAGNPTATELSIEAGREVSDLEAYVMLLEKGLDAGFAMSARWTGEALDTAGTKISQDFGPLPTDKDFEHLGKDLDRGVITRGRYLFERQRRGLYSDDMDIADELDAVDEEGSAETQDDVDRMRQEEERLAAEEAAAA